MEQVGDIRYTVGNYQIYKHRKECIERLFGTAKEYHGMRYTQMIGKAGMQMKVGLTYTCMNLKKLVNMLQKREEGEAMPVWEKGKDRLFRENRNLSKNQENKSSNRMYAIEVLCLLSEADTRFMAPASFLKPFL